MPRPGIAGMRRSTVIRLRPRRTWVPPPPPSRPQRIAWLFACFDECEILVECWPFAHCVHSFFPQPPKPQFQHSSLQTCQFNLIPPIFTFFRCNDEVQHTTGAEALTSSTGKTLSTKTWSTNPLSRPNRRASPPAGPPSTLALQMAASRIHSRT